MRVRESKRGPVVAYSEELDKWMKRRSSTLQSGQRTSTFTELKELQV